jgi:tRNA (cytidine/uridine-2'-O-)-methyltransferase
VIKGHPHIGLFQPEIPQNTGSIARLAAGSGCRLHLVRPFGFSAADRNLRRAGLDYWPFLDLEIHDHIEDLLQQFPGRCVFLSKKAKQPYWAIPDSAELFVFGRETSGLPDSLFEAHGEHFYQIPMYHPGVRSQNLSNAVSIVIYDRLRRIHSQGTTLPPSR